MTRANKIGLTIALHSLIWFVFLSLPTPFNPFREELGPASIIEDLLEPPRLANAILLIMVFYFNYHVAMPKLYFRKRYPFFVVSVLICFNCFFFLNYFMMPPGFEVGHPRAFSLLGNSFNLFMFIIVYAASFALCLYQQWQSVKNQMLATEISFLKTQISPHFLFNTLNSIYSLALSKSDKAPEAIVKLSSLMRYSISESGQDTVPLKQEIDYISNYIDLQKLRLTSKIKINYELDGEGDGKEIAPFLLIPFIENAFKHGVNAEENSDIKIKIVVNNCFILMEVANNKVYLKYKDERGTNIGITTTQKRLELLYPGQHQLSIEDNTHDFKVSLKINI